MSASSNSDNSNRRTTSRRRVAGSSSLSDATTNGNRRIRATQNDYKNYFEDDDNYDPEIIDDSSNGAKNNDCEITKSISASSSQSTSPNKLNRKKKSNATSSANTNENLENVIKLESITGLSREEAKSLLEFCDNSVEKAIDIHFSGAPIPINNNNNNNKQNGVKSASASFLNGNGIKSANKRTHNDIDTNDLISVDEDSSSNGFNNYSNGDDNVRAPIPPKIDRLIDYDPYAVVAAQNSKRSRMTYDGFRNMREEFNDGLTGGTKSLSNLFKPPIDLLFDGSFEASKIKACNLNKWVMLNVQCQSEFSCICLNRDIWSDETVKEIIKANFVFIQVYSDSAEGNKLANIYNIISYPFIAVLDPRTGEKLTQYQSSKLDPCSFCDRLTTFLCENEPDFKQNTENDIVEVVDEKAQVVIIDKKLELNGSSKTYVNGFSSQHKMQEKPKRAADILNSNMIETIEDTNDILDINNDDESSKKSNNSYEDDSVISKDKYNKMKQASNKEQTSETKETSNQETIENSPATNENYQPKIIKYKSENFDKIDCFLRILYPNGDRLDFTTNGNSSLKELVNYLISQGFNTKQFELIERLMPNFSTQNLAATTSANADKQTEAPSILSITQQSRNLFNSDLNITFKQLKLFPRVFLLLQAA